MSYKLLVKLCLIPFLKLLGDKSAESVFVPYFLLIVLEVYYRIVGLILYRDLDYRRYRTVDQRACVKPIVELLVICREIVIRCLLYRIVAEYGLYRFTVGVVVSLVQLIVLLACEILEYVTAFICACIEALKELLGDNLKAVYDKSSGTAPFKAGLELIDGYVYKREGFSCYFLCLQL